MNASAPSRIRITGGTHNKGSPPVDFLQRSFLPLIKRVGPRISLDLVRYGFYPRGGGEIRASIEPPSVLTPIVIDQRGERCEAYAEAYISAIPLHVASRELEVVAKMLNWSPEQLHLRGLPNDVGPGNALTITISDENVTEVFTGFGEKRLSAEGVAKGIADRARAYIASQAAIGRHLADQLLLPRALAGGGGFTMPPVIAPAATQLPPPVAT